MMRSTALLLATVLASLVFAGCFGGDDTPTTNDDEDLAEEAVATDEEGSITGQVVANDLEVIANAAVGLTDQSGTAVTQTTTDKQGKFTFNNLAPGKYRVQVSAVCCKVGLKEVTVTAGEVTDAHFQIARLTNDDLRVPYVVENEWNGFISCGVGAGVPGVQGIGSLAACSVIEDPNEEFRFVFNFSKGVQDAVFVLDWDAAGGVSGTDMWFLVEDPACGFSSCPYEYAELVGEGPLRADVHDEDITDPAFKWSAIEDSRDIAFRIFASPDTTNVVYQQPFTVYYTAFHYQDAPEDYDPIPDQ